MNIGLPGQSLEPSHSPSHPAFVDFCCLSTAWPDFLLCYHNNYYGHSSSLHNNRYYMGLWVFMSCLHNKPTVNGCFSHVDRAGESLQCGPVTFHLMLHQRLVCDWSILCFNCIHPSNCVDIHLSNIWKAGVLVWAIFTEELYTLSVQCVWKECIMSTASSCSPEFLMHILSDQYFCSLSLGSTTI